MGLSLQSLVGHPRRKARSRPLAHNALQVAGLERSDSVFREGGIGPAIVSCRDHFRLSPTRQKGTQKRFLQKIKKLQSLQLDICERNTTRL
jgi:hypothetical protein